MQTETTGDTEATGDAAETAVRHIATSYPYDNQGAHALSLREITGELSEEIAAAMISNLLVVLCGDRATQPVVNTGSLYH